MVQDLIPRDDTDHLKYKWDSDEGVFKVALEVWDTIGLDWVRMTQPVIDAGDLTLSFSDIEALLADNYFKRMQPYAYGSTRPKYICRNTDIDANLTDTDWYIWKYSDADLPTIEGPRIGACNTEGVVDGLSWNT